MNIGLDFDGVIGDSGSLKLKYIKKLFHLDVELIDCTREKIMAKGFTSEQYDKLLSHIYDTDVAYEMEEVENSIDTIKKLIDDGHYLKVITSRFPTSGKIVRKWMEERGVLIPVITTSKTPKGPYCRGLEVFLEDETKKLQSIKSTVDNLFIFTTEYNKEDKVDKDIIKVDGWEEFYKEIQKLKIGYGNLS